MTYSKNDMVVAVGTAWEELEVEFRPKEEGGRG